jgi:hypothetical protein
LEKNFTLTHGGVLPIFFEPLFLGHEKQTPRKKRLKHQPTGNTLLLIPWSFKTRHFP